VNVLILYGSKISLANNTDYPVCLTEVGERPLLERVITTCSSLEPKQLILSFSSDDIHKFHVDNAARLLAPDAKIVGVEGQTQGAACTALLASPHIDNDQELLILNGDELLDIDFQSVLSDFRSRKLDAGIVAFDSIHPRYSYVVLDDNGFVTEAAEKNPISRNATAGFYWYAHGSDFVSAAKSMIAKDARTNDAFYICPSFNELVLKGAKVGVHRIEASQYHPLKDSRLIEHYDSYLRDQS
jgi:dTDP-glucose pyrophosphorylase